MLVSRSLRIRSQDSHNRERRQRMGKGRAGRQLKSPGRKDDGRAAPAAGRPHVRPQVGPSSSRRRTGRTAHKKQQCWFCKAQDTPSLVSPSWAWACSQIFPGEGETDRSPAHASASGILN